MNESQKERKEMNEKRNKLPKSLFLIFSINIKNKFNDNNHNTKTFTKVVGFSSSILLFHSLKALTTL